GAHVGVEDGLAACAPDAPSHQADRLLCRVCNRTAALCNPARGRGLLEVKINAVTALLPSNLNVGQECAEQMRRSLHPYQRCATRQFLSVVVGAPEDAFLERQPWGGIERLIVADDLAPIAPPFAAFAPAASEAGAVCVPRHSIRRIANDGH